MVIGSQDKSRFRGRVGVASGERGNGTESEFSSFFRRLAVKGRRNRRNRKPPWFRRVASQSQPLKWEGTWCSM